MNKNDQLFMAQKIRTQYVEKEESGLDELRRLDALVKRPARVFGYVFGSLGAVVMGTGMSLIMTDIAEKLGLGFDPMIPGIIIGAVGLAAVLLTYPIYKKLLDGRKKKYSEEILTLSEKIINE